MNLLEVAVYAMVIGGANQPVKCTESDLGTVNCTNGLSATENEGESLRFSNGITVNKRRGISFSNGVTAHIDSAGWLEFSNGVSIRRDSPYRYRLNSGYICQLVERTMVQCQDGR
ncbi:MAG: hypothetical protein WCF85_19805 [Rhodospirillaceae bacterium]